MLSDPFLSLYKNKLKGVGSVYMVLQPAGGASLLLMVFYMRVLVCFMAGRGRGTNELDIILHLQHKQGLDESYTT